ncbi:ribosome recycling factor domain-containing protein [Microdochium trichocladiopsis]|uniref:Ribosome recycling factor domain-containing protein n=1 Tax=Microdochium trichocladiopsis TaxID=1682393 RepID=A0A9P9BL40_9PEZI|nr:ribosome recycling factor domain-containing protein [Microdochium trichocladiopsis]KAH7027682.1 ribosome recycling factor domain-containing protein [Microdochium trichocladiopsis]
MNSTPTARSLLQSGFAWCETVSLQNARAPLHALGAAAATARYSTNTIQSSASSYPATPRQQRLPTHHSCNAASRDRNATTSRWIHSTPALSKKSRDKNNSQVEETKGGRGGKNKHAAQSSSSSLGGAGEEDDSKSGGGGGGGGGPAANPEDPLNFDDVKARYAKQSEHFIEKLKKFRAGGRFNPDSIASLPVTTDKATGESYPLRELGQVVPKGGRTISIILHEAAYVKPVMSAIQSSADFNQQPQRDPDNELELILKIEAEKPDEVAKRIKALCHDWRGKVKLIRQKRDKQHTAWRKDGLMLADAKKQADKELEKVIKTLNAEIDAKEKETLKLAQVA